MTQLTHVNAPEVPANPAFSHAVSVTGPARTIYVGGQNAVKPDGSIDGDDVATQTVAALRNLELVLAAAGAKRSDIVSWTISVVQGVPLAEGFAAFARSWGHQPNPPAISVNVVAGLANPKFLVEVSAIAAVTAD